jgi:hypothetical protein
VRLDPVPISLAEERDGAQHGGKDELDRPVSEIQRLVNKLKLAFGLRTVVRSLTTYKIEYTLRTNCIRIGRVASATEPPN